MTMNEPLPHPHLLLELDALGDVANDCLYADGLAPCVQGQMTGHLHPQQRTILAPGLATEVPHLPLGQQGGDQLLPVFQARIHLLAGAAQQFIS